MEKPSVAFDPLPNSLPLQGKRALAAHPPSFHPRRVFGMRKNEKENEREKERNERNESFLEKLPKANIYNKMKKFFSKSWLG